MCALLALSPVRIVEGAHLHLHVRASDPVTILPEHGGAGGQAGVVPGDGVVVGCAVPPRVRIMIIWFMLHFFHLLLRLFSHLTFGKHFLTPGIDPMSSRKPYLK